MSDSTGEAGTTAGTPTTETATAAAPDAGESQGQAVDAGQQQVDQQSLEDQLMDEAFNKFLGSDAQSPDDLPAETDPAAQQQQKPTDAAPAGGTETPTLTDDQQHLLKRLHMTPEQLEGWSDEQRTAFFQNAKQREDDQRSSYVELEQRLKALESGNGTAAQDGSEAGGDNQQQEGSPDLDKLGKDLEGAIDGLTDVFGEDGVAPLKPALTGLLNVAKAATERADQLSAALASRDTVLVDLTIDTGIRDLTADYPSLSKAEAKKQVVEKFSALWKADTNSYRTGSQPLLERIREGLKAAAQATLGTTTEAAAQTNLVNSNKTQLTQQMPDGSSRQNNPPATEDDVYDQAFGDTIGKELQSRV